MENLKSNSYSHLTAKERNTLSFPAKYLLGKHLLSGDVLDFGCGFGKDVDLLKERGINIVGYDSTCPFCNPDSGRELIVESATAFSVYDKFPVNEGHVLVIPKKHCADYFELSFKEQSACFFMLNEVKQILMKKFNPDGFNIGINVSEAAGQTVPHVHLHLIPRFKGDVKVPAGGVRNVIPEKGNYLTNA